MIEIFEAIPLLVNRGLLMFILNLQVFLMLWKTKRKRKREVKKRKERKENYRREGTQPTKANSNKTKQNKTKQSITNANSELEPILPIFLRFLSLYECGRDGIFFYFFSFHAVPMDFTLSAPCFSQTQFTITMTPGQTTFENVDLGTSS